MRRITTRSSCVRLIMLLFAVVYCAASVKAQTTADCNALLKRDLTAEDPQQVLYNITHIKCFGMDSVDLKIFGKGPILGSLMMKSMQQHRAGNMTYGDLLLEINRMKNDAGYPHIRKGIITMNKLEAMRASPATWEAAKKLLKEIDTSDEEIENLHNFMLHNPDKKWNYHELVVYWGIQEKINDKKNNPEE